MLENYTIDGFENIQYQGYSALQKIEDNISHLFNLYGYHQIATPTFETYDFYAAESSILSDDLFKLVNHQGKVMVLKPDATLAVTRMAALNHHNSDEIIKFFYLTNIYRNFASPEIVKKELTQMGIEYFGNDSPECDGEVITLAIEALLSNGIEDVHIDLGHVGFINHLLSEIQLTEAERTQLFQYLENKNSGDLREFIDARCIDPKIGAALLKLPKLYGEPPYVFEKMEALCINDEMRRVVSKLNAIYAHLDTTGFSKYISFDLGFTNQMNYYSDIIFRVYINNWGESVINGGRYNDLSKKFGIARPACGFGIDLLKIMEYLEQNAMLTEDSPQKAVLLYHQEDKSFAYETAAAFRRSDYPAELFTLRTTPEECIAALNESTLYQKVRYYFVNGNSLMLFSEGTFIETDLISELGGR